MKNLKENCGPVPCAAQAGEMSPLTQTAEETQQDRKFVVLVVPNMNLMRDISSVAPFMTFDPQGMAQVPVGMQQDFIEYFENMGYTSEDYKFEEAYDLNNGYHDVKQADKLGKHGDRWFPDSETTTPPRKVGPSAAKHGNNPMFAGMKESNDPLMKRIIENYEKFKKSSK